MGWKYRGEDCGSSECLRLSYGIREKEAFSFFVFGINSTDFLFEFNAISMFLMYNLRDPNKIFKKDVFFNTIIYFKIALEELFRFL